MATCKDCLHSGICAIQLEPHYVLDRAQKLMRESNNVEHECLSFKGRSRFVELPIKLDEKVFYFDTEGRIYETTVTQLVYGASGFLIDSDVMFNSNLIGKRFFLTREAAEQALKERES